MVSDKKKKKRERKKSSRNEKEHNRETIMKISIAKWRKGERGAILGRDIFRP